MGPISTDVWWAFGRCETAQVHAVCSVGTTLVSWSPAQAGGPSPGGTWRAKGWLHPLELPFLGCILRCLFSRGITRVIGAARQHGTTWRGSRWWREGGAVVGGQQ